MTRVEFPEQTPEERAAGDAFWAAWTRNSAIYHSHQADQFLARLHRPRSRGGAGQCVCGAPDCQFSRSGE